ncbi:putative multiple sugar transport system permease protein [Luteococcus japonicus]|uniref:Xylose transport system permease protein XylH n=3 Tax=Luteococcus TaxID=33983 RepID=A0A1R4KL46_9ACTN|nr:sugar ABC transporter permease [Luteococcus japonicus]ROR55668.1 putative multiple sugar transport system permease protein [Luteococcus japonicus]SJN45081.1 Xylose ABC transporter, permease protein XylH [Luteococcus japonicus LSP_Lj1]
MKALKQVLGNNLQQYTMVLAMVVLAIFFEIKSGGKMLTPSNMQNLITGNAYVLIMAIGMLMVIVIGQIDLSVGSVAGFVGMFCSMMATNHGWPWWSAVLAGMGMGILIGAWHGFWLAKVGIPGFITTLAGMMIFRGAVIWMSGSISVAAPAELEWFGAGYLPEWGPGATGMNNSTLLLGLLGICWFVFKELSGRRQSLRRGVESPLWATLVRIALITLVIGYLTWIFGSGRSGTSFPVPGVILLVLAIVYHTITERTRFGRHVYAVGGNKAAAGLSGVNVQRTYFLVMLNMSFLAALAGILFLGRSTAAGPTDGTNWELDAIAAVFIGGAAVSGGIGTVMGSLIGGLVMAVLNSGLSLLGVGQDRTQVIKGLVLLGAVAFDVYNKTQGRPSIIGRLSGGNKINEDKPVPAAPADHTPEAPAIQADPATH